MLASVENTFQPADKSEDFHAQIDAVNQEMKTSYDLRSIVFHLKNALEIAPDQAETVLDYLLRAEAHFRPSPKHDGGEGTGFECFTTLLRTNHRLYNKGLEKSLDILSGSDSTMHDIAALQIDFILQKRKDLAKPFLNEMRTRLQKNRFSVGFSAYETLGAVVQADSGLADQTFSTLGLMLEKDTQPRENTNAVYETLQILSKIQPTRKPEYVRFFHHLISKKDTSLSPWHKNMLSQLNKAQKD